MPPTVNTKHLHQKKVDIHVEGEILDWVVKKLEGFEEVVSQKSCNAEKVSNTWTTIVLYKYNQLFTSHVTSEKQVFFLFTLNQKKKFRPSRQEKNSKSMKSWSYLYSTTWIPLALLINKFCISGKENPPNAIQHKYVKSQVVEALMVYRTPDTGHQKFQYRDVLRPVTEAVTGYSVYFHISHQVTVLCDSWFMEAQNM